MKKRLIGFMVIFMLHCSVDGDKSAFQIPKDYRNWKNPVDRILDYPVPGHGAGYRIIYANDIAFKARIKKGADGVDRVEMPEGSIVIKEAYKEREDINKKLRDITVMVKRSGDENALKGWLYYVKFPDKEIKRVDGRLCLGCHEAANEEHLYFDRNKKGIFRDYLFVPIAK
jgi:hypothetical protein